MRRHALMWTCMTIGIRANFDDFLLRTLGAMQIAGFCAYKVMHLTTEYCAHRLD